MSKADLVNLVKSAQTSLMQDTELLRSTEFNKRPHIFIVDVNNLKAQILIQINKKHSKGRKLTPTQDKNLTEAVQQYSRELYETFKFRHSKVFNYTITGSPETRFEVLITSSTESDVYRKIYEIRADKGRLKRLSKAVENIFVRDKEITQDTLAHLFDVGHIAGQSVAEKVAQEALYRFSSFKTTTSTPPELQTIINIAIEAEEKTKNDSLGKTFTVTVTDESYSANRAKATEEKNYLTRVRTVINNWIEAHGDSWATQGGSRSGIDIVVSELLSMAKKNGAKITSGKITSKSPKSTASTKIKGKVAQATSESLSLDSLDFVVPADNDWSSLFRIINSRLVDTVISSMKFPALQNRSGTFARSVHITAIEQTPQGYPSIVFDYAREPYDVFDKAKGAAPWNTPARDPKTLIDRSIREIVKDLAIGRFYTRRA